MCAWSTTCRLNAVMDAGRHRRTGGINVGLWNNPDITRLCRKNIAMTNLGVPMTDKTDLERAAQKRLAYGHNDTCSYILSDTYACTCGHAELEAALSPAQPEGWVSAALTDVAAERARQVSKEGWTPAHDDKHEDGEMAAAAAAYALSSTSAVWQPPPIFWPWSVDWWKPKDARRDLVRAGALIVAEIERIDRSMPKQTPSPPSPASPQTEPPGVQEIIAMQNYIRGDSPHPASDPLRAEETASSPVEQMDIPAMLRASEVTLPEDAKLLPARLRAIADGLKETSLNISGRNCEEAASCIEALVAIIARLRASEVAPPADTPRTDELSGRIDIYSTHEECVELARTLEREAARLQAELAAARRERDWMQKQGFTWKKKFESAELRLAEREKEIERRDSGIEALKDELGQLRGLLREREKELEAERKDGERIRDGLRWYADRQHYELPDWEDCSGESSNWLFPPELEHQWMVDNGGVARSILDHGHSINPDREADNITIPPQVAALSAAGQTP